MPLTLLLNVGQDPLLLETRSVILRAAGYMVESALSIKQAVNRFLAGDYDGVVLCHSIPAKDRERLTSLIRASGSLTPVVSISEGSIRDHFADATLERDPKKLLRGIKEIFIKPAKRSAGAAMSRNNANADGVEDRAWRKTVLCVDDDPNLLAIQRRLLENAGYLVLTTHSGPDGLKVFSTGTVDAVLLDYEMPVMNGGAVAARMRQIKPDVPIILFSGSTVLQEDLALFNRYIPKGGSPNALLSAVEEILSRDEQKRTGKKATAQPSESDWTHYVSHAS